jgi:hypothetical protein
VSESFGKPIPRSKIERKSTSPVEEENSVLTELLIEVLTWFFHPTGKHRDLLEQAAIAEMFSTEVKPDSHQVPLNIYSLKTYQWRGQPAIIVHVGSIQSKKPGLGIAIENAKVANDLGCLQKRSYAKYQIQIVAESASQQTTNSLAKLLAEIFIQHIPEYYQNVIYGDASNSQVMLPQEYKQSEVLAKDFQHDSNVERVYRWSMDFEVIFESIRFIKSREINLFFDGTNTVDSNISAGVNSKCILQHNVPELVKMGDQLQISIKTNLPGVKMYCSNPEIFKIFQTSGVHGDGEERCYLGRALRSGDFTLTIQDQKRRFVKDSIHRVILPSG